MILKLKLDVIENRNEIVIVKQNLKLSENSSPNETPIKPGNSLI
ncbi:Hypothetical protein IALB_1979 [Ignavibacterium album JCM 16511]|uniref:Uncharacterized protein n=1 Tax=Ignavibacterium album (strain DSM 19864 / JCM 16511 / NBRC 101810 / Mat9-16) TaxID=945713 RepID=I0AL27_IGNAJ|nr:Hypothetical protein IALB_1979 [Ignavibacterium album JCM 16511]